MKILSIAFLFAIATTGYAQVTRQSERQAEELELTEKDRLYRTTIHRETRLEEIYKFPEIHENNGKLLKDFDSDLGVSSDTFYTRYDSGKISIAYSFSHDIDKFTQVQSLDVNYARSIDESANEYWWAFQYKFTRADFEAVYDEESVADDNEDIQTYSFFGIGLGHRFHTIGTLFDSSRTSEMILVYLNYVAHRDELEDQNYTGGGYTADYTLTYRSSKNLYWGGKISYNWVFVEKPPVDKENLSERSKVFGWTTLGFEFGYIF